MRRITAMFTVLLLVLIVDVGVGVAEIKEYEGRWKHPAHGCGPVELSVDTESLKVRIAVGNDPTQIIKAIIEDGTLVFTRYAGSVVVQYRLGPFPGGDTLSGTATGRVSSDIKLVLKGGTKPTCTD